MASLGTVAFLSVLALKHLVVSVAFADKVDGPGTTNAQQIGQLEVPNRLLVHFYDAELPEGISGQQKPVFVEALNALLARAQWGSILPQCQ